MPLNPDTNEYLSYCPFFAAVEGRSEAEQNLFYGRYERLPEATREFLLSPATADALKGIEQGGAFPATHRVAVAKIVALLVLGDIDIAQVPELLGKLNLTPPQAKGTADALAALLIGAGVLEADELGNLQTTSRLSELPTYARPSEAGPQKVGGPRTPGFNVPNAAGRTILDLRKPKP